ncbi:ATP-binding cassette domain-containing protein [Peribacillus frigoritolerans]|uniref:ATP-binding cassette domain-containing protein n=1 Tax=Peribacillus frigoritolerans TaxID=450367 RepID=UPI0021625718|nr:ABC transporter ATP-binding protein [Peribacillus frigoritolerans]
MELVKTSLLKAILGISQPNSGRILFDDKLLMIPYSKIIRKKIGYLPDEPILSLFLTGLENLSYMNYIYDNPKKPDELISILKKNGIEDAKNVLVKSYSKGMKQRLSLAIIDLYNPALLILDEPTLGLDIVGVNHLKNTLKEYRSQGCTILLTTHDIHFCQEIADNVTLINGGINIDEGSILDWLLKYENIEDAMIDKLKIEIGG